MASDRIEYLSIDSDLLDVLLTWDQTGSYEVGEISGESASDTDDWMTVLLQTKAFHRIPPANIQAIFLRMQRVNLVAGETVIKQGDDGDFFYVITRGKCVVTRETPLNNQGIKLAELGPGDSFGEESLIAPHHKRSATVTAVEMSWVLTLRVQDIESFTDSCRARFSEAFLSVMAERLAMLGGRLVSLMQEKKVGLV